ncbi:3-oxoacyl-[acyl-carrier-protein] synthase II [Paenibacillus polysaccharolyticus]|uniref:Nodulation protein E n=1 Tax=Paenibacillus polysaccharolyticus TaxID=582692 RepID=A0A1G5BE01_9BACL|nr:beta-ketoacyl-[acyl-carrier-protein] synthase family protein [Paenibacillus polysaccharolyticus]SCX88331.1 3-oxoacyl-[acyl-carrier-protein] synthase II [Paenibacillus polysaccharolyticus]
MSNAVVTGIGIIASNGANKEHFFETIINGQTGLKKSGIFDELHIKSTSIAGEVDEAYLTYQDQIGIEEKSILMAYQAIDEALHDSKINKSEIENLGMKCGLSVSTSISGNLNTMKHIKSKHNNTNTNPEWLVNVPNYTRKVARFCKVSGATYTTVSACAAGTAGVGIAIDQIRNGNLDVVLVVGMDMLADISVAGFHSLESMSVNGCSPFDKNRDGTSLGEGAAAFIVESKEHAMMRNAHIYGELLGYGLSNDAYHITSPDPEGSGAIRAMNMALKEAQLTPQDIDYINVHGTATELNDVMEAKAITDLMEVASPDVLISSTKAVTGHCLGAAGSVEMAVILMALDRNIVPLTAKLVNVANEFGELKLVHGKSIEKEIKYAMSNSFAFSGNAASVIVGKFN